MNKEEINTICNVFVAFSTFLGVGGALSYYIKEILELDTGVIFIILMTYFILGFFLLILTKEEVIKNGKDKSNVEMD